MFTIFLHHVNLYDGAGYMAVTFFFILSGFSLTLGYNHSISSCEFSYSKFLKRRFSRLFPLHWLCLIISLPLSIVGFKSFGVFLSTFILNASLLQSFVPIKEIFFSFNWVSWFLCPILFFAIMFPYLLRVMKKASTMTILIGSIFLLSTYLVVIILIPKDYYHAILYINPVTRLLDFILGIAIALLFLKKDNVIQSSKMTSICDIIALVSFVVMLLISLSASIKNPNPITISLVYWIPASLLILSTSISGLGGAKSRSLITSYLIP